MAASEESSNVVSAKLSYNNEVLLCKNCLDYEVQLKVVQEELSSAKMISILQEEMDSKLTQTLVNTTNLPTSLEPHQQIHPSEWSVIAKGKKSGKVYNQFKSVSDIMRSSGRSVLSENRFSILDNLKVNESVPPESTTKSSRNPIKGNTIPIIVCGECNYYNDCNSWSQSQECFQVQKETPYATNNPCNDKYKVLLVGDSHLKDCAHMLQDDLGTDFVVTGFVQSGANMEQIVNTTEDLLISNNDDLVIIWGGANDIGRNNTQKAVEWVTKFVEMNRHQNVILINSPHRYDLSGESCINIEVTEFNNKIKKSMEQHPQVKILEVDLDRNHFIAHGLHLNSKGKAVVSHNLAMAVKQCVIPTPWNDYPQNKVNTTIEPVEPRELKETQELLDMGILPLSHQKATEETPVCDASNSNCQSLSTVPPDVNEDLSLCTPSDSVNFHETLVNGKAHDLPNDCYQIESYGVMDHSASASSKDMDILPSSHLKEMEEASVCDVSNFNYQSLPAVLPDINEDLSLHTPLDSVNSHVTSVNGKAHDLPNDCSQTEPYGVMEHSASASNKVSPAASTLEVYHNLNGTNIDINKGRNNDNDIGTDQSRLVLRNSNRSKKQPASRTDDFLWM
jgi:hypothetical protein